MKFFIDTADKDKILALIPTGMVDGVTTNPSLIAKNGDDMATTIKGICNIQNGPVSAEVTATDHAHMVEEGQYLASLAKNVVVKVPLTVEGLIACKTLRHLGIQVNVTLCFSVAQALLAAKAGATYISPFVGRLDDADGEGAGMDLIKDIVEMYLMQGFNTEVLVASIRNVEHVEQAALFGADVVTKLTNYLNYVNEQELELNEIEQQKSSLSNTFFKDIKDNHTNTSNNTLNV